MEGLPTWKSQAMQLAEGGTVSHLARLLVNIRTFCCICCNIGKVMKVSFVCSWHTTTFPLPTSPMCKAGHVLEMGWFVKDKRCLDTRAAWGGNRKRRAQWQQARQRVRPTWMGMVKTFRTLWNRRPTAKASEGRPPLGGEGCYPLHPDPLMKGGG